MKPLSIRWKFGLWSALATAITLCVFAAGTLLNLYHEQIESMDLELNTEARLLASRPPGPPSATAQTAIDFHLWLAYAVFAENERLEYVSPLLPEATARQALTTTGLHTTRDENTSWRIGAFRGERQQIVVLAYDLQEARETVADLLLSYALSLPLVIMAAAFGGAWVARRALAPVRALAEAAENISSERLDRRVPEPGANDEVRRLATVLNAMLARLEKSFLQTQRFAADASHELRTPLTVMRCEVEQLVRSPGLTTKDEAKLLSLQEEIGRLERIIEHLLLLARFDAGNAEPVQARVDFSHLVGEACEDAELLAAAAQIAITVEISPALIVSGDELFLRRLVLNLLDNAVRHNQPNGRVDCRLLRAGDTIEFRVRNTGPGIPAAMRISLFQRFFRADPARSGGGHGLGLALSREIARSHHGEVELEAEQPGWTELVVRLPAC